MNMGTEVFSFLLEYLKKKLKYLYSHSNTYTKYPVFKNTLPALHQNEVSINSWWRWDAIHKGPLQEKSET